MTDLFVNAEQWNEFSPDDQERFEAELKETGVLQQDDRIVGNTAIPAFAGDENFAEKSIFDYFEQIARCRVCSGFPSPLREICYFLCISKAISS